MAQQELSRNYFAKLEEANQRIFHLENANARLTDTATQLEHDRARDAEVRNELEEMTARYGRQGDMLAGLSTQLEEEKEKVVELSYRLDHAYEAIADLKEKLAGDEPRVKMEDVHETDDQTPEADSSGPPSTSTIDAEDLESTQSESGDKRQEQYRIAFEAKIKVVMDRSELDKPIFCEPNRQPAELWKRIRDTIYKWRKCQRGLWYPEVTGSKGSVRAPVCAGCKITSRSMRWRKDAAGQYACNDCITRGVPCFLKMGEEFWVLPVHPSNRTTELAPDAPAMERWVPPAKKGRVGPPSRWEGPPRKRQRLQGSDEAETADSA